MKLLCTSLPAPAGRQLDIINYSRDSLSENYSDSDKISIDLYAISLNKIYEPLGLIIDAGNEVYYFIESEIAESEYPTSLIAIVSENHFSIKNEKLREDWAYWRYKLGTYRCILSPQTWGEPQKFLQLLYDGDYNSMQIFLASKNTLIS